MLKRIQQNLKAYPIKANDLIEAKLPSSAVLLILIDKPEPELVFVLRSKKLRHHAGEIAFPGGKAELSDGTLADTALREAEEEIAIARESLTLIAQLPSSTTRYGLSVTPFVAITDSNATFEADLSEIDEVFTLPLRYFLDKKNRKNKSVNFSLLPLKFPGYRHKEHIIWGLTHRILVNFLNVSLNAQLKQKKSSLRFPWQ